MNYDEMNNLQRIFSDISGYGGLHESGARDDGYYESDDRINYIQEYALNAENVCNITKDEAIRIKDFLDSDLSSQNDWYHAFKSLE